VEHNESKTSTASGNISHVTCNGGSNGSIALSVSGGNPRTIGGTPYTYLWSNSQTTNPASGLTYGPYSVLIKDSTQCEFTISFIVEEPAVPLSVTLAQSNYNGYNIKCFGGYDGELTANVVGGTPFSNGSYNYQWPNGQNSQSFTNLIAGTYTVLVWDSLCSTPASATATLTEPDAISLSSFSSISASCYGYSDGAITVTPTGGVPTYSYDWSNGQSTQTAINLVAGTYTVDVTDANNCVASLGPSTVNQPNQISATLNVTNILPCNGNSNGVITATGVGGTTPPYTYFWSNNGISVPLNDNLTAGPYNVTITDGNLCFNTFFATVTEPSE